MAESFKRSTWREKRASLKANVQKEFRPYDTMPNWYQITNNGPGVIYVGANATTGENTFDLIIPAYGCRVYAKPDAIPAVFLTPTNDTDIWINSMVVDWHPSMVSQTQEIAGVYSNGLLGVIDIRNILGSLPAGGNRIGSVDVSTLPMLPTGDKTIGKVGISGEIPPGAQYIGQVGVDKLPGWKWAKVTATGAGDVVVKAEGGKVARLIANASEVIYLKDGSNQAWKTGNYDGPFPITCAGAISVNFAGAGDAWILYE